MMPLEIKNTQQNEIGESVFLILFTCFFSLKDKKKNITEFHLTI